MKADKPLSLWWVNHYAITPASSGGTRHYDMATELAKHGIYTTVFACDIALDTRRRRTLGTDELYRIEECNGFRFVWINSNEYDGNGPGRFLNMLTFQSNLLKVAKEIAEDGVPEAVIGSSPHLGAAVAAGRIAASYRSPFYAELRDLWPQALIDMGGLKKSHPVTMLMRWQESTLYRLAKKIIVLAKGSESYLVKYGLKEENILLIPNGVHLGHFAADSTREANRAKYGFTKFTAIYTGAHGPANALENVVKAAKLVDPEQIEFVLVGDGPSKANLVALAKEIESPVRFMAPVSKSDVPSILGAADAGVITLQNIPAFAYGVSPNKLFDYMGAKLPVICAVPGDMADIVGHAKCGLVIEPENPEEIAGAATKLCSASQAERAEMGVRGREVVTSQFDRQKLAKRLADFLHLNSKRSG